MKLNKSKNKGKVHPSPSASSSSSPFPVSSTSPSPSPSNADPLSSLKLLLPAAILTLISVLSLQDREVLAYMITRSLKSADETITNRKKNKPKKSTPLHKSPSFDCGCFECYTSYWFRWDSSPHRELIHQAIEAFEEHLSSAEHATTKSRRREKEKEKEKDEIPVEERAADSSPSIIAVVEVGSEPSPESIPGAEEERESEEEEEEASGGHEVEVAELQRDQQQQQHKGLARKVLPDVIGLFNSRLWSLWGPTV